MSCQEHVANLGTGVSFAKPNEHYDQQNIRLHINAPLHEHEGVQWHNGRWGNPNTVPRETSPSPRCPVTAVTELWGLLPTGVQDSWGAGELHFWMAQDLL